MGRCPVTVKRSVTGRRVAVPPPARPLVMRFTAEEESRIREAAKLSGWQDSAGWAREILLEMAAAVTS